jgi:predicted glycosyltransferase
VLILLKFWFDILTPKQVMFFKPIVDSLRQHGHELLCTSRDYREAVQLARIKHLDLKIIGRHGGAGKYEKLCESANRIFKLADIIKQFEPDTAVTFSSPEGSRVAFGLGIKHIGLNDSPHADSVAKLTIPLMNHLFCPWVIPYSAWYRFGICKNRITKYRALDPAAWLKRTAISSIPISSTIVNKYNIDRSKKTVLIRLEEAKASYIADKKIESKIFMIDALVKDLSEWTNIIILCRYEDQIKEIAERYEGRAHVIQRVIDGTLLISLANVFIGAGGTMTAEASLLGKPTISIAPIQFYVEKYLLSSGLVQRACSPTDLVRLTKKMIIDNNYAKKQKKKAKLILDEMDDPVDKILPFLEIS